MADLDPAHVAAIAAPLLGRTATSGARQILTSTDPDVHAALLAALVCAGVLSDERRTLDDGWASQTVASDGTVTNSGRACTVQRRYVTRWEDA